MNTLKPDIAIIGGGIVGIATAYYLIESGINCVLIEKDPIGSHASGFAYGSFGASKTQGLNYPLALKGVALHKQLSEFLPRHTGIDIQYREKSSISLAFNEQEKISLLSTDSNISKIQSDWLDPSQIFSLEPSISKSILGGVFVKNAMDVNPYNLLSALHAAIKIKGVNIIYDEVVGINVNSNTSATLNLKNSTNLSFNKIVISMGPWSNSLSDWINIKLPIKPLKGQILRLSKPGILENCSVSWSGNYANLKPDGLIWTGTTEENEGYDESTTIASRNEIMLSAVKMIPDIKNAKIVKQTSCLRPMSQDNLPILGSFVDYPQIYVGTGALRSGITLGPAMGKVISELILQNSTDIDITPFNPDRFE